MLVSILLEHGAAIGIAASIPVARRTRSCAYHSAHARVVRGESDILLILPLPPRL